MYVGEESRIYMRTNEAWHRYECLMSRHHCDAIVPFLDGYCSAVQCYRTHQENAHEPGVAQIRMSHVTE